MPVLESKKLSVCMIVKNESAVLARCLNSVVELTDDIVLVDTGSTDNSVAIAKSFDAKVYQEVWQNDFAHARNTSLKYAQGEWILVIDADEVLPPDTIARFANVLALRPDESDSSIEARQVVIRNLLPEGDLLAYEDVPVVRLFKNRPMYRYEQPIHEQILPSIVRMGGGVASSDLVIVHDGYQKQQVQAGLSRLERNLPLLLHMHQAHPEDAYVQYQLGISCQSKGEDARAYSFLSQAIDLSLKNPSAGLGKTLYLQAGIKLAQLDLKSHRDEQALARAEECLFLDPNYPLANYVAFVSSLALGRFLCAKTYLSKLYSFSDGMFSEAFSRELAILLPFLNQMC